MDEDKNSVRWGLLDVAARTLESIPEEFKRLYDKGTYRMRPEDTRRMGIYLKRNAKAIREINKTLTLFKNINA